MKIQWLGTAAAEGFPALFCECEPCLQAAKRGGPDLRTRSSALIDDILLIDLSPDLLHHKYAYDLKLSRIRDILITHVHGDHFYPFNLRLHPQNAFRPDAQPIGLYGSHAVIDQAAELSDLVDLHEVPHGRQFTTTEHRVTAIPAVHGAPQAQFFLIERDAVSLLYAHDTDYFSEDAWGILEKYVEAAIDVVSLDSSLGPKPRTYVGHMGFAENIKVRDEMLRRGLATTGTTFVCSHFIHTCGMLHDEMLHLMNPEGFEIAFDGMTMEISSDGK